MRTERADFSGFAFRVQSAAGATEAPLGPGIADRLTIDLGYKAEACRPSERV